MQSGVVICPLARGGASCLQAFINRATLPPPPGLPLSAPRFTRDPLVLVHAVPTGPRHYWMTERSNLFSSCTSHSSGVGHAFLSPPEKNRVCKGEAALTPPRPRPLPWGMTGWCGSLEPPPAPQPMTESCWPPFRHISDPSLTSPSLARPCVRGPASVLAWVPGLPGLCSSPCPDARPPW